MKIIFKVFTIYNLVLHFTHTVAAQQICKSFWFNELVSIPNKMTVLEEGKKIIMVGDYGSILTSLDSGKTWVQNELRDRFPYFDIDFFNDKEGIIVRSGYILKPSESDIHCFVKTEDGGNTWLTEGVKFLPLNVHVVNNTTAYVNTYNGKAYKTGNRGKSWEATDYKEVNFLNRQIGVGLKQSKNEWTIDGGNTWQQITNQASPFAIGFKEDHISKCVSQDGNSIWVTTYDKIYKSSDKGNTWISTDLPLQLTGWRRDAYFFDKDRGYILTSGEIYLTTDGGKTFTSKRWLIPSNTGKSVPLLYNFQFINTKIGFIYGSYIMARSLPFGGTTKLLYRTLDGGHSWEDLSQVENSKINDLDMINNKIGFLVNDDMRILKTEDGGISWKPNFTGSSSMTYVKFFDSKIGVATDHSYFYVTEDAGKSWSSFGGPLSNTIARFVPYDKDYWFIFADGTETLGPYITRDRGKTFNRVNTPLDYRIHYQGEIGVVGRDTLFIIAVGQNLETDYVYRSTNGGSTWELVLTTDGKTGQFQFVNNKIGFLSVPRKGFYTTSNGGQSWTFKPVNVPLSLQQPLIITKYKFFDAFNGSFSSNEHFSNSFYTKDGGNTWQPHDVLSPVFYYDGIYAIDYISKDSIIMAGGDGHVLLAIPNKSPQPTPNYVIGDTIVKVNDTVNYKSIFALTDYSINWEVDNKVAKIIYKDSIWNSVSINWTKEGRYSLKLISQNDCGKGEAFIWVTVVKPYSNKVENKPQVHIYPNPTTRSFFVKPLSKDIFTSLKIYSIVGKLVFSDNNLNFSEEKSFDVDLQLDGVYFLELTTKDNRKVITKLVFVS